MRTWNIILATEKKINAKQTGRVKKRVNKSHKTNTRKKIALKCWKASHMPGSTMEMCEFWVIYLKLDTIHNISS